MTCRRSLNASAGRCEARDRSDQGDRIISAFAIECKYLALFIGSSRSLFILTLSAIVDKCVFFTFD
ncbi:hypothetical protein PUN28_011459 [Cardiocondyla obscurior]|uniref:Uncharacterized protein n=1 Tax=Cardiocondyla obscurior TaxID=286306 RepID=A0AAW2FJ09_9HYME